MKQKLYVFGFDNTLVNTEDLIVDITNEVLGINMTKDFWYENLHSVSSPEEENRILEESFNVKYTPEIQQKTGSVFVQRLGVTHPNSKVFSILKDHLAESRILSGSPLFIMQLYFRAQGIEIPEEHYYAGVYNGSGEKEKILARLQKEYDVVYYDDDSQLVGSASRIVFDAYLVRQPYNSIAWNDLKTIECK